MRTFIVALLLIMFMFDLSVSLLNYRQRNKPLADNVKGIYDEVQYQKWLAYTMEKLRLEVIQKTFNLLVLIGLLSSVFFSGLETLSQKISSNGLVQTLIFLGGFMGLQLLLGIGFEWIDTFKIEANYGFNKTSIKTFWLDQLKGLVLGAMLLGGLVVVMQSLFIAFIHQVGSFILFFWLFISGMMILIFVLNTKVFVRLFNKLKPIEDESLKKEIESLAKKTGFEVKSIFVMDASKRSTKLNAYFSGLGKMREVVLYDTLIAKLSQAQILAVLAHELGHAKHKDTLRMLMIQILVFGIYALGIGYLLQTPSLSTDFGLQDLNFGFSLILFMILSEPIGGLIGIPVSALSRTAEYKADAYAVKMSSKAAMSGALKILGTENFSNLNPHPFYVLLHYSHPPLAQRLDAIKE